LAEPSLGRTPTFKWYYCPECTGLMVDIAWNDPSKRFKVLATDRVFPMGSSRPKAPPEVPDDFASDYNEACLVLPYSAKAAAALGRRCLQHILREKANVRRANLEKEIQEVLDTGSLPSYLAEAIDAIRQVGNFAAHPVKSTNSGEVAHVEPGEAEWTLDTLEQLFDFYFVAPATLARKREALNTKLADLGKPPLK
jgi:hypothetical protein